MRTIRAPARAATRWSTIIAVALATATALGGCGQILGEDLRGLTVTVVNHTDRELAVEWVGHAVAYVSAGKSGDAEIAASPDDCVVEGVTASADDGASIATMPTPICDGDTWVIEQSDLVSAPDQSPTS